MRSRRRYASEAELRRLEQEADELVLKASSIAKAALRGLVHVGLKASEDLDFVKGRPGDVIEISGGFGGMIRYLKIYMAQLEKAMQLLDHYENVMKDFWDLQDSLVEVPRSDPLRRR